MRILHVITGIGKAAGTSTFVTNVVREQRALGHEVEICTNATQEEFFNPPPSTSPSPSTSLSTSLSTSPSPSTYSLFHIHGLWSPLTHRAARFARKHRIPVVWSTHGMTAPWALHHKWWKKCLPWYLYQRRDLRRADLIHCTTDLEESWNHALGLKRTFIAPLGTTLSSPVDAKPRQRTLLYVGRIYPVKALDNLIRAFALAVKDSIHHSSTSTPNFDSLPPWHLRLIGPDQAGHLAELKTLCDQLGLPYTSLVDAGPCPHQSKDQLSTVHLSPPPPPPPPTLIEFPGPKYDADLDAEYDACTALALVSHTENFGATVVDALAHSKPVITSTNTPWKIVQGRCGWWVPNDPEFLSKAILELMSLSDAELAVLGANGRKLVEDRYAWPAVAKKLAEKYEYLLRQ